jgi:hypothetical protein
MKIVQLDTGTISCVDKFYRRNTENGVLMTARICQEACKWDLQVLIYSQTE